MSSKEGEKEKENLLGGEKKKLEAVKESKTDVKKDEKEEHEEENHHWLAVARFRILSIFIPFVRLLKDLTLIPRTWFPAIYLGNRKVKAGEKNKGFPTNHVSNTKYTWFTFLPHNIAEQFFMSHMNRYFFFVAVVQLWGDVTPVNPVSTWVPLILVYCLTACFALIDDVRRFFSDSKLNNKKYTVIRNGKRKRVASKNIKVGDIVELKNNQEIPCDLVIFYSSGKDGSAFIQTANLDGEIDLKPRPVPKNLYTYLSSKGGKLWEEWIPSFKATITCPQPNAEIYSYNSVMKVEGMKEKVILSADQLLLQSCSIKNTDWVLGICTYNGNETKCGMNKRSVPSKRAKSDYLMDKISLFVFLFQMCIFFGFGVTGQIFKEFDRANGVFYLDFPKWDFPVLNRVKWFDPLIVPVRFWLLTTYMIPISLKVTLDFMKLFYSLLIMYDRKMYDEETNTCANSRNSAIVEDLGQIEYILTDKTGTLTQNVMEFQRCSILKQIYGNKVESALVNSELMNEIKSKDSPQLMFFRCLALCHTCTRDVEDDGSVVYHSVSPDEEALVKASVALGVNLIETGEDAYTIEYMNDDNQQITEKWKILRILKFTSDRKRMSVIVKNEGNSKIFIFSKGADDIMLKRIDSSEQDNIKYAEQALNQFAKLGLRTLVVGYKEISETDYSEWNERVKKAESVIGDQRKAKVDECCSEMENNMKLIGTTAIEDKLQDKVPETIAHLREAGISVWMLTGDKFETAKQIGYSCNLVTYDYPLLPIVGKEKDEIKESIEKAKETAGENDVYSIIIEGSTLKKAFDFFALDFKKLCLGAKTVICARVTPGQKAEIVKLVKKQRKLTLAIGDGGNDVPMIQEAHVGVGLTGKEGLQASRASDFSFGKFKFLTPLLFTHGNYSLVRSGIVIQYSFYKNIVLAFLQVLFNVYTHFSGASPYNDISLSYYNTFFTIFVPIVIFDRIIDKKHLLQRPKLYSYSKKRASFNPITGFLWIMIGIIHAVAVLFIISIVYMDNTTPAMSGTPGTQYIGIIFYTALSYVVDITFLLFSNSYNSINIPLIIIILLMYHAFIIGYNVLLPLSILPGFNFLHTAFEDDYEIFFQVFEQLRDVHSYLSILLAVTVCTVSLFIYKYLKVTFYPSVVDRYKIAYNEEKRLIKEKKKEATDKEIEKELLFNERLAKIGGGGKIELEI